MTTKYMPLLSIGQQIGDVNMPISYMTNISGPLSKLQSELDWHLHDLAQLHQIVYNDLNKKNSNLDIEFRSFQEKIDKEKCNVSGEEEREWLLYQESKTKSSFISNDAVIDRCKRFSDEFSVIGLWATAEKFMGKVYANIEHQQTGRSLQDIVVPYRWDQLVQQFQIKSIMLNKLDGYADANECRVLNNTIKHGDFVSSRLADFTFFSKREGEELQKIDYEMQRYYNGISSFIGSLIEFGNKTIDPDFSY